MEFKQQQLTLQRSIQASKQMVYGVFENMIGDLEELERRDIERQGGKRVQPGKSDVRIPSMASYSDENVERITETQLLIFQSQLNVCPNEIRGDLQKELSDEVRNWSAARSDCNLALTATDHYAAKLMEILKTRKTALPDYVSQPVSVTEEVVKETMSAFMGGQEIQRNLDKSFRDDSDRLAKHNTIRKGHDLEAGLLRLHESAGKHFSAPPEYGKHGDGVTKMETKTGSLKKYATSKLKDGMNANKKDSKQRVKRPSQTSSTTAGKRNGEPLQQKSTHQSANQTLPTEDEIEKKYKAEHDDDGTNDKGGNDRGAYSHGSRPEEMVSETIYNEIDEIDMK